MTCYCILDECESYHSVKDVSYFGFPRNPIQMKVWIERLKPRLPPNFTAADTPGKHVCSLHFPPETFYSHGVSRRLFPNALPYIYEQPKTIDRAVQCRRIFDQSAELEKLKKEHSKLQRNYTRLSNNPTQAFLIKHLSKLRAKVCEEAYLLFVNALENYEKNPQNRRHSLAIKQLTNHIQWQSVGAYKLIRTYFALPSNRTMGRMGNQQSDQSNNNNNETITEEITEATEMIISNDDNEINQHN